MTDSLVARSTTLSGGTHIIAATVRSAVGVTAASAAAAVRAGISSVSEHPYLLDSEGENVFCCRDPFIAPSVMGTDRMIALARRGFEQLGKQLAGAAVLPIQCPVLLALPETRPGFSEADGKRVIDALSSSTVPGVQTITVEAVGEGHAGALLALKRAVSLIASGERDLVILGGVDSYLDQTTVLWLDAHRRLARPGIRSGFPPGEASAFLALTSDTKCRQLGLQSRGCVRSVACTREERNPASETGLLGEALTTAVLSVCADLPPPPELITDLYGDINGELARSHDWGFAVMRAPNLFRDGTDYVLSAGQCGDVGAATAAFGCILAGEAWRFDSAEGSLALVWAGSWNGLRGAAVIQQQTM